MTEEQNQHMVEKLNRDNRRVELIRILQTRIATVEEMKEVYGPNNWGSLYTIEGVPYDDAVVKVETMMNNLFFQQFRMRLAQEEHEEVIKRIRGKNT